MPTQRINSPHKQTGATLIEYAFMVMLIAMISFAIITSIGKETEKPFNAVNRALAG